MSGLRAKKVLLGISGSIAAYKAPLIVRLLIKSGAEVQVVITPKAKDFVTPLTLSTLSNREVLSEFTDETNDEALWNNHVELGLWADLMLIAPASANTLSKMASAACDNLLLATYLSAKCPVYFAPAMDLDMHQHPATQKIIQTLESYGNIHIPSSTGFLASGLEGVGRLKEPEEIITFVENHIDSFLPLRGKNFLITAGPTYESLDPVRFIGNFSSGKMGFALANAAASLGAQVNLISGPTASLDLHPEVQLENVQSTQQMFQACMKYYSTTDVVIMAAAVADFKPAKSAKSKIKKEHRPHAIFLDKTIDILKKMGTDKQHQILIGFALETENEMKNAQQKIISKNLDAIVLNSLSDPGAGFGHETNKITFIKPHHIPTSFPLKSKKEVAYDVMQQIKILLDECV